MRYESGTRVFVWGRPVKDERSEDSQEAHVFCPRRGFLLEGLIQSESAVGVRLMSDKLRHSAEDCQK